MVEYLFNAVRAVAGQDITIAARITDDSGTPITDSCGLMFHGDNDLITMVSGVYYTDEQLWQFTIAAEVTEGLQGRYWYCFCENGNNLCFKQPIYLV